MNPHAVSENLVLSSIIKDVFPDVHARRVKDAEDRAADETEAPLPVFLYPEQSFPGDKKSWRFFEPRYRLLCRKIKDSGVMKFGYFYKSEHPAHGDLILVMDVTKMEERHDGTFIVEAQAGHALKFCPQNRIGPSV